MEAPTPFQPAHDLLIPLVEVGELAALLSSHPDRLRADSLLAKISVHCGANASAEGRATISAYQSGAEALARDGEIEVAESPVVSQGGDGGAYVQAWLWVSDADAGLPEQPEAALSASAAGTDV